MASDEFSQRVQNDVGAVIDGTRDIWSGKGVVDHQGNIMFVRNFGNCGNVQNIAAWIPDCLGVDELRFGGDRPPEIFGVIGVHKREIVAQTAQRDIELRERATVERAGGNDVAARPRNGSQSQELRRLTTGGARPIRALR